MPVPYSFAQYPNGSVIPLGQLDANFAYIETQIAGGGGQVLAVVQGGTGATTPNGAMANLLPIQTGAAGQFLTTDGAGTLSWAPAGGGGGGTSVSSFSAGTTGLLPNTATAGVVTLSGTLSLLHGGTGATTQAGAANAIMPPQAGQNGKFLITDGTNVSWAAGIPGSGTVTSVDVSGGLTGLTFAGGPIVNAGVLTLGGVLAVSNGGTGTSGTPLSGQVLIGNGTNYTLNTLTAGANITITNGPGTITIAATGGGGGGVTDISFGTTGLTPNSATSGSVTVAGTLNIANGGTGANNAVSALNALLPAQAGNANYVLKTDGAGVVSWTPNTALAIGNYGAISVASASPGPGAWSINNSYVTPVMLSAGAPSWNGAGLLSASNFAANGGATSTLTLTSSSVNYSVYSTGGGTGSINVATPSGNLMSVPNTAAAGIQGTGPYTNTSDATLKENISEITDSLEIVKNLSGVYFNWIEDVDKKRQVGLIAQDVEKVLPEVVSMTVTKKLGIAYASIVPVLINAINDLEKRVAALEAKG